MASVQGYIDPGTSATGMQVVIILALVIIPAIVFLIAWWRIFGKAGWPGALGLLMIVPLVNIVLLLILAFAEWPIERELRYVRAQPPPPS